MVAQGLSCLLVPMGRQIVQDDNGAWPDLWNDHFADVGGEGRTIHCTLDDPWCDQCVWGQARNQCLCSPTAKGCVHGQAVTALGPATQARKVRLRCRFIKEDNTIGQCRNDWKPMFKRIGALLTYPGAAAFGGNQRLFCK